MKYFTKELWLGYNSDEPAVVAKATDEGEKNLNAYWRQLQQLEPRLSKRNFRFFTEENLHDGRLLALIAGDGIPGSKTFNINRHNTSVRMSLLGQNLDSLYTLTYRKLRRVTFDYPTTTPLFHEDGDQIGDWGYDELTAADEDYFRHEILFASGTTILIEFKQFSYSRRTVSGSRYSSIDATAL